MPIIIESIKKETNERLLELEVSKTYQLEYKINYDRAGLRLPRPPAQGVLFIL